MGGSAPDMTDDWMNPPKREQRSYTLSTRYPRFLIERQRRLDYFPFTEWAMWKTYETRDERDQALKDLIAERPAWQVRSRDELHPPRAYL